VAYHRGWENPRGDELGVLWEHMVLNELHAHVGRAAVRYWRSKQGHEVDFVLASTPREPTAIECKWTSGHGDPAGLQAFRRRYPKGENIVVASDVRDAYSTRFGDLPVRFMSLPGLVERLQRGSRNP
jgi:predicted AAA+ superfamily ATPase